MFPKQQTRHAGTVQSFPCHVRRTFFRILTLDQIFSHTSDITYILTWYLSYLYKTRCIRDTIASVHLFENAKLTFQRTPLHWAECRSGCSCRAGSTDAADVTSGKAPLPNARSLITSMGNMGAFTGCDAATTSWNMHDPTEHGQLWASPRISSSRNTAAVPLANPSLPSGLLRQWCSAALNWHNTWQHPDTGFNTCNTALAKPDRAILLSLLGSRARGKADRTSGGPGENCLRSRASH